MISSNTILFRLHQFTHSLIPANTIKIRANLLRTLYEMDKFWNLK